MHELLFLQFKPLESDGIFRITGQHLIVAADVQTLFGHQKDIRVVDAFGEERLTDDAEILVQQDD